MAAVTNAQVEKPAKKTADEKREEARYKIKKAAIELFYEKGYENTTTRDIVLKTGILNGSIYNRFHSKEDILVSAITDGMRNFLDGSRDVIDEVKDPMAAIVLPSAVELYLASISPRAADILYNAHRSWEAVCAYADIYTEWYEDVFSKYGAVVDRNTLRFRITAILGTVGNVCAMYAHGSNLSYREVLTAAVRLASGIVEIPVFDVPALVDKVETIVESGEFMIAGHSFRDIVSSIPKEEPPKTD
jgi:AcrR family transcriptional regulator